jgi:lipopolysaccharide transport system ATP-binding protein
MFSYMPDIAIKVEGLGKRYRIGAKQEKYKTLRDTLTSGALLPFRVLKSFRPNGHTRELTRSSNSKFEIRNSKFDTLWALKDVSFEVKRGEVIGIIGRNGAGKSTLLKILSRITEPTEGYADIHGRVASLLEVGTGFHQELTGRENIYLNGAILGMKRDEIERKFDEIVAFAEVEKFIDTPVKHYSSGMHLRLAFAVSAHLEPEILLVDEVLAVGDVQFQRKCLGKIGEVAGQGRTVLFVSHNMPAVKSLCGRGILLRNGQISCSGDVISIIDKYLTDESSIAETGIIPDDFVRQFGNNEARFRRVEIYTDQGEKTNQFYYQQKLVIRVGFEVLQAIKDGSLSVGVGTTDGTTILHLESFEENSKPLKLPVGYHQISVEIPVNFLPGTYSVHLGLNHLTGVTIDWIERSCDFTVLKVSLEKDKDYRWTASHGFISTPAKWHMPENFSV